MKEIITELKVRFPRLKIELSEPLGCDFLIKSNYLKIQFHHEYVIKIDPDDNVLYDILKEWAINFCEDGIRKLEKEINT